MEEGKTKQNKTDKVYGDFVTIRIQITLYFTIDGHYVLHQHINRRKYIYITLRSSENAHTDTGNLKV